MPSVHLSTGDVLLGLRHGAHLEALWTSSTWTHDGRQSHRACFHLPHAIKLLLHERGPETDDLVSLSWKKEPSLLLGYIAGTAHVLAWSTHGLSLSLCLIWYQKIDCVMIKSTSFSMATHALTFWGTPSPQAWSTLRLLPGQSGLCSFSLGDTVKLF